MLEFRELLSGKKVNTNAQAIKIIDLVLRELAAQRLLFLNVFAHHYSLLQFIMQLMNGYMKFISTIFFFLSKMF